MAGKARKFVRVTKFLLAGVTLFCVSWIASVSEWHTGVRWNSRRERSRGLPTMRTIVAYSEGKQAEMERPTPVVCDTLPAFPDIMQRNCTWPDTNECIWQHVAGIEVSLYAAYYDDRTLQRHLRILATFHGRNFSTENTLYCQTRSLSPYGDFIEVVAARPLEIWWHEWDATSLDVVTPLLLSCPLTEPLSSTSVVSIVTQPCDDPTNAFLLHPFSENSTKRNFTVCVKDLKFEKDISHSLVEWIEINKLLGVDIIDIYVDDVSLEVDKVIKYYRDKGFVRIFNVPIKYKQNRSLWQRRRDHIITYNDCLYRNIRESEFIIPLDIDEIILPKKADTLSELLTRLKKYGWNSSNKSAIMIRNIFFFDFMQGVEKYKRINPKNVYDKRDDVRIKHSDNIDVGEIELFIDNKNNISNTVIDLDKEVLEEYKVRFGKEMPIPKLSRNIVSSAIVSPIGYYSKSMMMTEKVLTAFNHYPLASLGTAGFAGWAAPLTEVQLNHYKESCNSTVVAECAKYGRRARLDTSALRLHKRLSHAIVEALFKINADKVYLTSFHCPVL